MAVSILPQNITTIPAELKALPQWVVWKYGRPDKTGKLTKIPYDPKNGNMAKVDTPTTWGIFEQAVRSHQKYKYSGIGFVFSENDPYYGIDLDKCIDPTTKELLPWSRDFVEKAQTYTEITPSGTGLHIIGKGKLPREHNRKGHIEMYDKRRFFTMTGQVLEGYATIEERQAELDELFRETFKDEPANVLPMQPNRGPVQVPSDIIERAKSASNGAKFSQLWAGDTSNYSSQSEADQALCNMFAFWCGRDPAQIDSIFRQSGLYREKWERQDYRERTIARAIEQCREVYEPARQHQGAGSNQIKPAAAVPPVEWEEPLRLSEFDPPPFPSDALPSWLCSFADAAATSLQVPVDMPGTLALAACGAAVAGKFIVRITPDWKEPLVIQVLLVMFSGERKTAALAEVLAPIEAYERELAEASRGEIARQKGQKEILEHRLHSSQGAAAKAKGTDRESAEEEAANLAQDLADLEIKAPPRLIVDDASPEKIASLLCEQGGRLALFSAEGGIFDILAGRYTSNGVANFDVFLKGHAGDPIRVDRIGRPPEFVKSPALTIGMTVQPDVLSGLFEKPSFRGRGLLARFLYSQPRSLMGHRQTNPAPVPPQIKRDYFECLQKLLGLTPGTDERGDQAPNVLHLSAEAQQLSREFASWLEPKLEPMAGELSFMADWAGKLHGAIIRMAGILHLAPMPEGWSSPISGDTFARAVRLGKYFLEHAKGTFGEMGANQEITDAKYLLSWITKSQISEFKKQDCWQSTRGYFREAKRLDATLDLLVEYGHVRQQETEGKKRGRPSAVYQVNPLSSRDSRDFRLKGLDPNLDPLLISKKPDTAQETAHDSDLISWTV